MRSKTKVTVLLACAAFLFALPAMADPVQVFVGYADNLRASGFFPNPWAGSAGVVFSGQDGSTLQLDSGAVRIDNTSANSITISNLTIKLNGGAQTAALWGPMTLLPGQVGIFDQTTQFNLDTSDFGFMGAFPNNSLLYPNNFLGNGNTSLIGGCSSSATLIAAAGQTTNCNAAIPVVSFTVHDNVTSTDTPFSFNDTGHILDTGAWDFVNNGAFGEDGNESINWNVIGGTPNRGGSQVPEPSSIALFGTSLLGCVALLRRKLRKQN
ncbi:MAG TPA: PEP-CTERM sorting domain-containing protein [Bryobacteraceae bacterium]|nr:PEP-CTERM sorting domain-containing protein [Bryobacteraceae bacterium]